jgi:hypothetical protein
VVEVMSNFHERCFEINEDRNLVNRLKMANLKKTIFNHNKNIPYSIGA